MFSNPFKIIYLAGFIIITVVRKIFTARLRNEKLAVDNKSVLDITFLALNGIGMIIPLIYVFIVKLDFADYSRPDLVGYLGAVLFLIASWLLYRSHADLNRNWIPIVGLRPDHKLITTGVYKKIRHPMYSAHMIWAIAQAMILPNWIAGFSFLIVLTPHIFIRMGVEEKLLVEQFSDEYQDYMNRSGRLLPRLRPFE
ncbi:MAG: isoprenylcysteine carboxylmethyltransferase family protein [Candidatus Marinimicrobia bacterium]|nr:isoprenylcysteine carboxylmethyltransferase family protein [Candidatus Neomarinimicrobiota bacterium]